MRKSNWISLMMALILIARLVPVIDAQETTKAVESAAGIIEKAILETGLDAAVQKFRELRSAPAGRYDFKENDFNTEAVAQDVAFADSPLKKPSIFHPGIAPDESYIVFDDNHTLYVSFREGDGSWGAAVSLGEILGERMATIPSVSPDGKYLFYASHYDLHWVSTKILEKLRSRKTE